MLKIIKHIAIILSLVVFSSLQLIAQSGTSPVGINFILVNFNQPPTTLTVNQAPLKYNKDFAFSMQVDDANLTLFTHGYPVFEDGEFNSTTYPGLFYSDGCGNTHSFKMSSSVYVFNSNGENGPDTHLDNSYNQLTWEQMNTIYNNNWGILNHGVNGNANTDPAFIDYSIKRNKSYIRRKLYNTTEGGVMTYLFVNPNGSVNWTDPAFSLGNIGALNQNETFPISDNGGDVNNPAVDWTQPYSILRRTSDDVVVPSFVDGLANSSVGGANYWCPIFTHSLTNQYSFNTFVSDFNYVADTYGLDGLDNILMATDEEILDYLIVRDATTINYNLSGTSLLITFSGEVPDNLLYYSSSLVVNSDALINSITINGTDDYTYTGIGETDALINLNWDGYKPFTDEYLADSMVTIATASQSQYDCWVAMDYVITMTNGQHKDSLRQLLCNIPNKTYDDGFCNCEITLQQNDTTIQFGDCIDLYGPDGDYTYEWFIEDSLVDITQDIFTCPTDTTQYNHIATNPLGCPAEDSIIVNINFLSFNLGPDTTICDGNCDTIAGPPDMIIYNWFVADTLYDTAQIIVPCPIDTTQYILWVEDEFGANAEDSIIINVLPTPIINIQPSDTTINEMDCIELFGAIGDYTYEWFIGDSLVGTTQDIYTCPPDTTQYNHIATNTYGCSGEDSIMVNIEFLSFSLGPDTTICAGECDTITGPPDMIAYNWFVADTLYDTVQIIVPCPVDTTQYILWVEDEFGANAEDSIIINVLPSPIVVIQPADTTIKYGTCITLFGTEGDYLYEWFIGDSLVDTTLDIYTCPIDTTQYNFIATASSGCSGEDSTMVNIQFLSFDLGNDTTICNNECITINGPDSMVVYNWIVADTLYDTVQSISPCPLFTTKYKLWVEDTLGGIAADSITINTDEAPVLEFEYDSVHTCLGNDIELNVIVESMTYITELIWSYNNHDSTYNSTTYTLVNPDTSDYVYIEGINIFECSSVDSTYLTILDYPEIVVSNDTSICYGQSLNLSVSGGSIFRWIVGNDTISTDSIITVSPEDTTTYIVQTAFADSMCFSEDSVKVAIHNSAATEILYDTNVVCSYEQLVLTATGANEYVWMPGGETTLTYTFTITDTTTIWLTGTTTDGCQSVDSVTFYNKPSPEVSFTGLLPAYCENDPYSELTGTPEGGIFSGSGIVGNKFYPQNTPPGVHEIKYAYTDLENCTGRDTVITTVYGNGGSIDIGPDFNLLPDESQILDAGSGFDSYFWTTGATTQSITVYGYEKEPGTYEYAVMGVVHSCSSRGSTYITFENPDGYNEQSISGLTIFPNPNDGSFSIKFNSVEKNIQLFIYNLQQQLLYERNNISCDDECNIDVKLIGAKPGFYFLHITTPKGVSTSKIILK